MDIKYGNEFIPTEKKRENMAEERKLEEEKEG